MKTTLKVDDKGNIEITLVPDHEFEQYLIDCISEPNKYTYSLSCDREYDGFGGQKDPTIKINVKKNEKQSNI